MSNWTSSKIITSELRKKWDRGDILRNFLHDEGLFPMKINLKVPNSSEFSEKYSEISKWINELKQNEKTSKGYGYLITYKETNYRNFSKNTLPYSVTIETIDDAIKILKEHKSVNIFLENSKLLKQNWSFLEEWIMKNPRKLIDKIGDDCNKIIKVLKWFENNPSHYIYLREIAITGIDTKFIEKNKSIIEELLIEIVPEQNINIEGKKFEDRFNIKQKPIMIRFRILDERMSISGFTDLSVPVCEFQNWENKFSNVFFTENEINFLSFPNADNSIIIFGKGYGVDVFKSILWLNQKNVYYWGDIDTHGFNILSIARKILPNIKSFLMTEEILKRHEEYWVFEEKQYINDIPNLTNSEKQLVNNLQNNTIKDNIRLEQERVRFDFVKKFVNDLLNEGDYR